MYFHVLHNAKRDGQHVYILVKTYKTIHHLLNHLRKEGQPAWIIESRNEWLPINNGGSVKESSPSPHVGGYEALAYNSGAGLFSAYMPLLPLGNK